MTIVEGLRIAPGPFSMGGPQLNRAQVASATAHARHMSSANGRHGGAFNRFKCT